MTLRFDPVGRLIVVPTRLAGPKTEFVVQLALDTGATQTMLNSRHLVLLGYDPASLTPGCELTTASGVESAPEVTLRKIEALDIERVDMSVVCHDLPPSTGVDGVLGLDFFQGRRLVIDFRQGTVDVD